MELFIFRIGKPTLPHNSPVNSRTSAVPCLGRSTPAGCWERYASLRNA